MASQNAGDKSTEMSVRTQDLIEEDSHDENEDDDDDDDDLSEQISYADENDQSGFREESLLGPMDRNEDDDDYEDFSEEENDHHGIGDDDQSVASQDSTVRNIDAEPISHSASSPRHHIPQDDFRSDAHGTLQDLIDVYSALNQVSSEQYLSLIHI